MVYFFLAATFFVSTFAIDGHRMSRNQKAQVVSSITKTIPVIKPVKTRQQTLYLDGIELMNLSEVHHA